MREPEGACELGFGFDRYTGGGKLNQRTFLADIKLTTDTCICALLQRYLFWVWVKTYYTQLGFERPQVFDPLSLVRLVQ